jgi:hypothetical protein
MNTFVDNLIVNWAWRVNDGMPDPKNRDHIELLEATLRDLKYSEDFISEYISQLREVDDAKVISYKEDGETKKMPAKSAKTMPDEHPAKQAWDKLQGSDDSKEEKPEEDPQKLSAKDGDFERTAEKDREKESEKSKEKPKKDSKYTPEQVEKEKQRNSRISEGIDLLVPAKDAKRGAGTYNMSKEDQGMYKEYLTKSPEDVSKEQERLIKEREDQYGGPVEDKDVDDLIEKVKQDFKNGNIPPPDTWAKFRDRVSGKGAPPEEYISGKYPDVYPEGHPKQGQPHPYAGQGKREVRFREIIRHYLATGGVSPITGQVVPLHEAQLDHIQSLDNGGVDEPDNWMWMEDRFNQFKGSRTDDEIRAALKRKGFQTENEELLKLSQTELVNFNKEAEIEFWKKQFKDNGKNTGLSEKHLKSKSTDELNNLAKGWNEHLGDKKHPDYIIRRDQLDVTFTNADGEEETLTRNRNNSVKPIKGRPETYGLVRDPSTNRTYKNTEYEGLNDEEAYEKSMKDYKSARAGTKKISREKYIERLKKVGAVIDTESTDNTFEEGLNAIKAKGSDIQKEIDQRKSIQMANVNSGFKKAKIVDKAMKEWSKLPETIELKKLHDKDKKARKKDSENVMNYRNAKANYELEQWEQFGEDK